MRNVPPYAIVGGNLTRELKKRFPDEQIRELPDLKWWDWNLEKITRHVPNLMGKDPAAL